jgi:hypothetical protein
MVIALVVVVALALIGLAVYLGTRRSGSAGGIAAVQVEEETRPGPRVAEFHVKGDEAFVHFEVPLPEGEVDEVLSDLLAREAIEVVREKRHSLPIDDVHRVVAMGRRGSGWERAASVTLDTPGELPPPVAPDLMPRSHTSSFEALERISDAPEVTPGVASRPREEGLPPIAEEISLPRSAEAGLRATGVDPASAGAGDLVLGLLRMTGHAVTGSDDTWSAAKGGDRLFVRVVDHETGGHPELGERDVDRFVVDFVSSGATRGILVTEKFGPFEIYDRERRDTRMRFITRERLQQFVDALALG